MAMLAIDYASVDGNRPPDFQRAKAAGARVIIARGAYGRRASGQVGSSPIYLDPVWNRDRQAILEAGLLRSSYLFVCMPRKGYTTPEPEVQAQLFADYVKELRAPGGGYASDYPPIFDVEEQSSLPAEDYFQWILRAACTLRAAFGCWPIMYSSQRVWTEYLRNRPPGELENCPQWVAKPWPWAPQKEPAHLDGAPAYKPNTIDSFGDATNWLWYQYQGDAKAGTTPGFSSTTDLSRCQLVVRGAKGDIVRYIQGRVGTPADGVFGPATETAVKNFQGRYGLVQDGQVGPATWVPLVWQPAPR